MHYRIETIFDLLLLSDDEYEKEFGHRKLDFKDCENYDRDQSQDEECGVLRGRIVSVLGGYIGEVYCSKEISLLGIYPITIEKGWHKVTNHCITKFGAKYELKKWRDKYFPEEFNL